MASYPIFSAIEECELKKMELQMVNVPKMLSAEELQQEVCLDMK